jgi:hypothetical protein
MKQKKDGQLADVTGAAREAAPYPGLRYYKPTQTNMFAAREDHVKDCFALFNKSRILILHGTTGCGKSSFLRAGLKPHVERLRGGQLFKEDELGELQVLRSGAQPLREIAQRVYRDVADCKDRRAKATPDKPAIMHGGPISSRIDNVLKDFKTEKSFVEAIEADPEKLVTAIMDFEDTITEAPVIVIDQAEEIFTITTTDGSTTESDTRGKARKTELTTEQVYARTFRYFKFLSLFARQKLGTKIIISLRTEYKGQFDDRLGEFLFTGSDREKILGYHLPDLDDAGMKQAIVLPTKDSTNFKFADGVPELIVEKLMADIQTGGRLPVLQIVCLRLWLRKQQEAETIRRLQQGASGRRAEAIADRKITVTALDVHLLGPFQTQISDYLRDRLREMSVKYLDIYRKEKSERAGDPNNLGLRADKWMSFFRHNLVEIQADGRATTRIVPDAVLREAIDRKFFKGFAGAGAQHESPEEVLKRPGARSELDWLAQDSIGVLRKERKDSHANWMLGHDSIGLVLDHWNQVYGETMESMMMMDMAGTSEGGPSENGLYLKAPEPTTIYVPEDLLWDRYLIQFAIEKKYAQRLGLDLREHDDLRSLPDKAMTGISWQALADRLDEQRKSSGKPVLFICERNNIDESASQDWLDIAIADEFAGNALIGPPDLFDAKHQRIEPLAVAGFAERDKIRELFTQRLDALFDFIFDTDSKIVCYDESAVQALEVASRFSSKPERFKRLKKFHLDTEMSWDLPYSARDFLFEHLWEENEKQKNSGGKSRSRTFIIGSDFGRAIAQQAGFVTYFGRQELQQLQRMSNSVKSDAADAKTVTHAIWNLGYPPNMERNKGLEYRLASLAYFLAEQVRRKPDEFVRFVYDRNVDLQNNHNGFAVSQEIVRDVIQSCFNFYHFDRYGRLFYHRESSQRYWVEDEPQYHASTSRSIYFEMQAMRSEALQLFGQYEALALERKDDKAARLADASRLARMAWNHYDIFNFYDCLAHIQKAVNLLSGEKSASGAQRTPPSTKAKNGKRAQPAPTRGPRGRKA